MGILKNTTQTCKNVNCVIPYKIHNNVENIKRRILP